MDERRKKIRANHSSIHIIQKVLQDTLSKNIHQAGSYVDDERLRFDFTYTGKISDDDIVNIEDKVKEIISKNIKSEIKNMSLDEAKKLGAMALFTDKYKDIVRVVKIGDSIELCGGTHIECTDEIKRFAILKVESKGSNLYRLEACTNGYVPVLVSEIVAKYLDEIKKLLTKAQEIVDKAHELGIELDFHVVLDTLGLSSYRDIVYHKNQLEYIQKEVRDLEKEFNDKKASLASSSIDTYLDNKKTINGIDVIIMKTENKEINDLKTICDEIINKLKNGLVFFANIKDNSVNFLCKSNNDKLKAGNIVKKAAEACSGRGGGSPTFAQGGASSIENIDKVLEIVEKDIKEI